jgi:hypothetical protein
MMDCGLFPTINLIIGIPEEMPDELLQTIEQTMCYVDKPCQVSLNIKMYAYPGAPIWDSADYPTKNEIWIHPETGEKITVPRYYLTKNRQLAEMLENLEQDTQVEVECLKTSHNMGNSHIMPRLALSLCVFNVIAKKLGAQNLSDRIRQKLDDLICAEKR